MFSLFKTEKETGPSYTEREEQIGTDNEDTRWNEEVRSEWNLPPGKDLVLDREIGWRRNRMEESRGINGEV